MKEDRAFLKRIAIKIAEFGNRAQRVCDQVRLPVLPVSLGAVRNAFVEAK
jgi:hypothetical protein